MVPQLLFGMIFGLITSCLINIRGSSLLPLIQAFLCKTQCKQQTLLAFSICLLSEQAFDELISLQMDIQDINYDPVAQDSWSSIWGHSNYSSRQFYKLGFMDLRKPPTFTWIWKSKCTPRLKFFAWLIVTGRLNTKAML